MRCLLDTHLNFLQIQKSLLGWTFYGCIKDFQFVLQVVRLLLWSLFVFLQFSAKLLLLLLVDLFLGFILVNQLFQLSFQGVFEEGLTIMSRVCSLTSCPSCLWISDESPGTFELQPVNPHLVLDATL